MNYLARYIKLIEKAKNRKIKNNEYYEKHHIIPKSLFNNQKANETLNYCDIKFRSGKKNSIKLLAREHFIAHLLLLKIFKDVNTDAYEKMLYAANFLTDRFKINSKKYLFLKKEFSSMMSKNLKGKPSRAKGYKWTKERKEIGQVHLRGKTYEEIHGNKKAKELKQKRSSVRKNKTLEEICGVEKALETKKKLSNRVFTSEWKEKISKAKKGKPMSEECKAKISKFMKNDKLNKNVDQTKYIFKNIKTGKKVIMRKYDMKKKYGCNTIYFLVNGKCKQSKGWIFLGVVKNED